MTREAKIGFAAVVTGASLLAAVILFFIHPHWTTPDDKCIQNLRAIDGAKLQWALVHNAKTNAAPTGDDIRPYLPWRAEGGHVTPRCPRGGAYVIGRVADAPTCSVPGHIL